MAGPTLDRILRVKEVCEILGCHRVTLWRRVRDGHLKARKTGPTTIGFLASEVQEYIDSLPAA